MCVLKNCCGCILITIVLFEFLQVVMRYFLGTGMQWAGEVTVLLLMCLTWTGAAALWLMRAHLDVDVLGRLGVRVKIIITPLIDVFVLIGIVWLIPHMRETVSIYGQITMPTLPASASLYYYPAIAGFVLFGAAAILNLITWHQKFTDKV